MSVSFTGSLTLYLWRSPRYSERAKRTTCPRCDQRGKPTRVIRKSFAFITRSTAPGFY